MSWQTLSEGVARWLFAAAAAISILAVALICLFLFANGIPAMAQIGLPDFLLGCTWKPGSDMYGIFPMIVGSLYVTAGAIVVGVPAGILTAIFLSRFANASIARLLKPAVELLAGIPAVVYGFIGHMVVGPLVRTIGPGNGLSLLAASFLLGIMILPTIITVSKNALDAVPQSYYEGALALGAGLVRTIFRCVLPSALPGIFGGVLLALGRCVGEVAALLFTAGTVAQIPDFGSEGIFALFDSCRTLAVHMYVLASEGLHLNETYATAVVLLVLVVLLNTGTNLVVKRLNVQG